MKIAELFYSLQGEGSLVGVPSVFIRTSGCNLRCAWCDTPYTSWQPEGVEMPLDRILDEVRAHPARHVVVTGGEPMIAPEIVPLTERLRALGLHITIETAGTVFQPVACDLMSISPKLSNSTPAGPWAAQHDRLRIQPRRARRADGALRLPIEIRDRRARGPGRSAGLARSPCRRSRPRHPDARRHRSRTFCAERALWLAEICKQEGFRFSPRLHMDLWGDRRGV